MINTEGIIDKKYFPFEDMKRPDDEKDELYQKAKYTQWTWLPNGLTKYELLDENLEVLDWVVI